MDKPDIFLSYNREDSAKAKLFAEALAAEGFTVWWDATLKSGENYDEVTEQALLDSKAVVVLWSEKSVVSRWVRAEATEAERAGKLVPAMIEPCKRPIMFELKQTAELSHWKGDRKDAAWLAFVADLRGHVGRPAPVAPQPAAPAAMVAAKPATNRNALIATVLAVVLALGAVAYWAFGGFGNGILSTRSERIPLLVRAFAASGGGNPDEAALATGITDELIVRLRRIPELQIGSGQGDGAATSGEFKGAHVVDGTIRYVGDRLRVTARLSDAGGEILWSETFDSQLVDLFQVQERIAAAIADALSVSLDVGANSVEYGGTNNPEAYAAYIQGNIHLVDFDQTVPVRYYERAIQLDPNYIHALAGLAATYGNRLPLATSEQDAKRMLAEMDSASARTLEVNPKLAVSNSTRGWYDLTLKDLPAADKMMRRAIELDAGNDPQFRDGMTQYAVTIGRGKQALSIAESIALIDPIFAANHARTIFLLTMNGRYSEAIELYDRLVAERRPGLEAYLFHVMWAKILLGDESEAMLFSENLGLAPITDAAKQIREFEHSEIIGMSPPELRRWAAGLPLAGRQFFLANSALAAAYRDHDALAVDLLRIAFEQPGGYALFYLWHPALAKVRKTDAFEQLAIDLGFVKAWRDSGDWGDFCRPVSDTEIACK